jgi:hypothetical protein
MAWHITQWLTDETARTDRVERLEELRAEICHPGAAQTAADYVLEKLGIEVQFDAPKRPEQAHAA